MPDVKTKTISYQWDVAFLEKNILEAKEENFYIFGQDKTSNLQTWYFYPVQIEMRTFEKES